VLTGTVLLSLKCGKLVYIAFSSVVGSCKAICLQEAHLCKRARVTEVPTMQQNVSVGQLALHGPAVRV
jgi:hypothetical protein